MNNSLVIFRVKTNTKVAPNVFTFENQDVVTEKDVVEKIKESVQSISNLESTKDSLNEVFDSVYGTHDFTEDNIIIDSVINTRTKEEESIIWKVVKCWASYMKENGFA